MDITLFTLNLPSPLSFLFKPPLSNIELISNAFVVIRNIYIFIVFGCRTSQLVQPYFPHDQLKKSLLCYFAPLLPFLE